MFEVETEPAVIFPLEIMALEVTKAKCPALQRLEVDPTSKLSVTDGTKALLNVPVAVMRSVEASPRIVFPRLLNVDVTSSKVEVAFVATVVEAVKLLTRTVLENVAPPLTANDPAVINPKETMAAAVSVPIWERSSPPKYFVAIDIFTKRSPSLQ
jgi:hypothetical protein